ncbi:peptidoglycan editing factor PgeF [Micavibrio aeruginosavorus]|uniref:Purine nucleoside phosphorylase n=1 Tax=Micavibrio aeruginosavorus (strain ARL-13) TaxID=856793 RepID=G2KSI5_MICAA|nr:peptidoglycan editing factor PgeF [Micavibrio aeruginosavorus]AEP09269.1 putative uncharacterized protein [Micavibrio aeruginosavorus ARL-13]
MTTIDVPCYSDGNFISPMITNVAHGFFGRRGGVSNGLYTSLNCGLGTQDNADAVVENRKRVADVLGAAPDHLISMKQVHSATCVYVEKPWTVDTRPDADGFVTDVPGLALGVLTADCGPVLFYGEKSSGAPVIGAAHAGWGGALKGVLESTVREMARQGAGLDGIHASIGPCIGPASYEVKMDFIGNFLNQDPENERFFKAGRGEDSYYFDLPGYITWRLAMAGVRHVSIGGQDTYAADHDWFSYRRSTHRKETDYGRQISAIMIRN